MSHMEELEGKLAAEKVAHRHTKIKLAMREHENHAITQSRSYKLATKLAVSKHYTKKGINHVKSLNPKTKRMLLKNKRYVRRAYESIEFKGAFNGPASCELAVVVHLYYVDMLPLFKAKLSRLKNTDHDLYITIPDTCVGSLADIHKELPGARVAVVPNCGRDVLPFLEVMQQIKGMGYSKILKLHSKKSPHRADGAEWRDRIIDNLLPNDQRLIDQVLHLLDLKDTALIGPADEYVSMLVNFSATSHHTQPICDDIIGSKATGYLMRNPNEYGFFGGTMFWARADAIMPIITHVKDKDFEPEFGQEDSTLAHALERLLNVIPEIQKKKLYELRSNEVAEIAYSTTNIPHWSEQAIDE